MGVCGRIVLRDPAFRGISSDHAGGNMKLRQRIPVTWPSCRLAAGPAS